MRRYHMGKATKRKLNTKMKKMTQDKSNKIQTKEQKASQKKELSLRLMNAPRRPQNPWVATAAITKLGDFRGGKSSTKRPNMSMKIKDNNNTSSEIKRQPNFA